MACHHRRLEKGFIFILYWCQGFGLAWTSVFGFDTSNSLQRVDLKKDVILTPSKNESSRSRLFCSDSLLPELFIFTSTLIEPGSNRGRVGYRNHGDRWARLLMDHLRRGCHSR